MTDEERRRYLIYAHVAAHLRAAAGLLHDLEPDLARVISAQAGRMYAAAAPLIGEVNAAPHPQNGPARQERGQ